MGGCISSTAADKEHERVANHGHAQRLVSGMVVTDGTADFTNKQLKVYPNLAGVARADMIQTINMESNKIANLSEADLAPTPNVKQFKLAYNILAVAPSFHVFKFLEVLELQHNKLTEIPPNLHLCEALHTLNVEDNKLVTLNPDIGQCRALRRLNISDNMLKAMPIELAYLNLENGGLEWSNGGGNPDMVFPPREVRELGQKHIMEFLQKQAEMQNPIVKERKEGLTRIRDQERDAWSAGIKSLEYNTQDDYEEKLLSAPKWMGMTEAMAVIDKLRLGGGWFPPDDYAPPNPYMQAPAAPVAHPVAMGPSAPAEAEGAMPSAGVPVATVCGTSADAVYNHAECTICLSRAVNTVLLNCGHACTCLECSALLKNECPVCRAPIDKVLNIYW